MPVIKFNPDGTAYTVWNNTECWNLAKASSVVKESQYKHIPDWSRIQEINRNNAKLTDDPIPGLRALAGRKKKAKKHLI